MKKCQIILAHETPSVGAGTCNPIPKEAEAGRSRLEGKKGSVSGVCLKKNFKPGARGSHL
jgi:hypothetical protein